MLRHMRKRARASVVGMLLVDRMGSPGFLVAEDSRLAAPVERRGNDMRAGVE